MTPTDTNLEARRRALRALQELARDSGASGPGAVDDFLAWRRDDWRARESRLDRLAEEQRKAR